MKRTVLVIFLVLVGQASGQSKYGLNCVGDACVTVDQKAQERMATAKTICSSQSNTVNYRKDSKPSPNEMNYHWRNIDAAAAIAARGYTLTASCTQADLIIRLDVEIFPSTDVSINVTDADSGDAVFAETRPIQDEQNDLARLAMHFHNAAMAAKTAERERIRQAQMAERESEEQDELVKEARRCDREYDLLRADIVAVMSVQHRDLPPEILARIADHNSKCRSVVVPERVVEQAKKEEEARLARETEAKQREAEAKRKAEEQAAEQAATAQRNAQFAKVRDQALTELQQRTATMPFLSPAPGNSWMQLQSNGPTDGNYYIVLFNEKAASQDCHFVSTGKHAPNAANALDCLHLGRNPYFLLTIDNRLYALKSVSTPRDGVYAGEVKDNGRTVCLRDAGCHQILAEIRRFPTALPEKPNVPPPGATTASYKGMGIQFSYPSNWTVRENKRNNVVTHLDVSPPEAHFASWVTHGMFVGHFEEARQSPMVQGAFDTLAADFHKNNGTRLENNITSITVDGQRGLMAAYSAPSIFTAGEHGYLVVVKAKNDGYSWFLMFWTADETAQPYQQLFMRILQSVKFE